MVPNRETLAPQVLLERRCRVPPRRPIVHWAHTNTGRGFASLGMRFSGLLLFALANPERGGGGEPGLAAFGLQCLGVLPSWMRLSLATRIAPMRARSRRPAGCPPPRQPSIPAFLIVGGMRSACLGSKTRTEDVNISNRLPTLDALMTISEGAPYPIPRVRHTTRSLLFQAGANPAARILRHSDPCKPPSTTIRRRPTRPRTL